MTDSPTLADVVARTEMPAPVLIVNGAAVTAADQDAWHEALRACEPIDTRPSR